MPSPSRRGFTLIELMVVLAIIVALAGLTIPVLTSLRERGKEAGTKAMVSAVAAAIAGYQTKSWTVKDNTGTLSNPRWTTRTYRMWDCNGDHLLDTDPLTDDAGVLTATERTRLVDSGYKGFYIMAQPTVARKLVKDGRLIDYWGTPLRIGYAGDKFYDPNDAIFGSAGYGVWSAGRDKKDVASGDLTPAARVDDITSWNPTE